MELGVHENFPASILEMCKILVMKEGTEVAKYAEENNISFSNGRMFDVNLFHRQVWCS